MTAGGPADLAGLRKDDKVLSVNGHNCVGIDHYEAVDILKAAGSTIEMNISREVEVPVAVQNSNLEGNSNINQQNGHHRPPRESTTSHDETVSLSSLSQPASSHSQKSLVNKSPIVVSKYYRVSHFKVPQSKPILK